LRLDADEMWALAVAEKARRRFGDDVAKRVVLPPDTRLVKAWDKLGEDDRQRVVRIAEQLPRRNVRSHREARDDEKLTLIILDD
jgi:hypothetical protein